MQVSAQLAEHAATNGQEYLDGMRDQQQAHTQDHQQSCSHPMPASQDDVKNEILMSVMACATFYFNRTSRESVTCHVTAIVLLHSCCQLTPAKCCLKVQHMSYASKQRAAVTLSAFWREQHKHAAQEQALK